MKILSRRGEKDYYDYLVQQFGIDEKVVYDRRNSTVVGNSDFYDYEWPSQYDLFFSDKEFKCDKPKVKIRPWSSGKYKVRSEASIGRWKHTPAYIEEGSIYHLLLEVGYKHFIFEVERYIDENGALKKDVSLVNVEDVGKDKKISKEPLYICQINHLYYNKFKECDGTDNPILKGTWIPKFISAEEMWNMLYAYISSLNDKEFVDTRTNDQHIESHGFDRKISFRHRK